MSESVVKKMARPAPGAPPPVAPTAALALSMRRACDKSASIDVHIADANGQEHNIDDALKLANENDLIIEILKDGRLSGCAVISSDLRAAIVESLTMGMVNENIAEARTSSGADAALCTPVLQHFMTEAIESISGTAIDGWMDDLSLGQRLDSTRILELSLTDETLRVVEVVCKLVGTKREGRVFIIAPAHDEFEEAAGAHNDDWIKLWRPVAEEVPAKLEAILHRMVLGLEKVEDFRAGDVIPLLGAKVTGVRLADRTGAVVAKGRLGQLNGHRALRIEAPPVQEMSELGGLGAGGSMSGTASIGTPDLADGLMLNASADLDMGANDLDLGGMPEISGNDGMLDIDSPDSDILGMASELSDMPEMELPEIDMGANDSGATSDNLELPEPLGDAFDMGSMPADPTGDFDLGSPADFSLDGAAVTENTIDLDIQTDLGGGLELPETTIDLDMSLDLPTAPVDLDGDFDFSSSD